VTPPSSSQNSPKLTRSAKDLTQPGPSSGVIWLGDDTTNAFVTQTSGFARVRSIAAHALELINRQWTWWPMLVAQVMIFFGAFSKRGGGAASATHISARVTLGAPDDLLPSQIQSEYLVGILTNSKLPMLWLIS
jgi:hypothetical protein